MQKEEFAAAFMDARGAVEWQIAPDTKTDMERVVAGKEFLLLQPCRCGAEDCAGWNISGPAAAASHTVDPERVAVIAAGPWYQTDKYRY